MFSKKQFLIIALIFIASTVGAVAFVLNNMQTKAFEQEAHLRADLVLHFSKAARTYTKKTLRPAVQEKTDDMVFEAMSSTFVTQGIVDNFREQMPEYTYRQASLNPLNIDNKADDYETRLIAAFKADPSLETQHGYRNIDGKEYYYTAKPIIVESKCLKCHDSVENVLATQPEIVERYGDQHGYDWIVGDTIAAQLVQIPTDDLRAQSAAFKKTVLGMLSILVIILVSASYFFFSRALRKSQEAAQAKNLADQANKSKSQFLASMSHEIRTPMTAILGFADTIHDTGDIKIAPKERVEAIETIKRNGEHLLTIINDILDLSKIESDKLEVEKITCSPIQIITEVKSLLNDRATDKGLDLKIEFNGPLPQSIQSDPTRLRQILINIVGNAIKFTQTGSVTIAASLIEDNEHSFVQFDIIDTGIGLTQEQSNRLFNAFSQADSTTTRKFGGTGLGLNISKKLANMLGGDITITSTPGTGSTFSIQVRTESLNNTKLIDDPASAMLATPKLKEIPNAQLIKLNTHVLLAEDGPDNQKLITLILEKSGATVTVAPNGKIAMDVALKAKSNGNPFNVILMDMQMPVMDGYTATTKLRRANYTGPIIALTAHAMESDRAKCINAGCDDFATKPINKKALIQLIADYTNRGESNANKSAA